MPKKQVAPPSNDAHALSAPVLGQLRRCIEIYDELRRIDHGILDPEEINVPAHKDRTLEQTVLDVVELIAGVKPDGNKFKFPDARAKLET